MLTHDIVNLLKITPNLTANEICEKFPNKPTTVKTLLNYMFRRKLIVRDVTEIPAKRGRQHIFIYRANHAATQNEQGVDVGQPRTVCNEEQCATSS
jgi:predicted transcriptional regulator